MHRHYRLTLVLAGLATVVFFGSNLVHWEFKEGEFTAKANPLSLPVFGAGALVLYSAATGQADRLIDLLEAWIEKKSLH